MKTCSVIDFFCGVGGITQGFVQEGFNVVAGLDSDESCKYAYEHNNGAAFIHKRIEEVCAQEISALFPEGHIRAIVGCAPCQPYSKYTNKYPKKREDGKWKLVSTFADVIMALQPEIVSMENVPELMEFDQGAVYNEFVERLKSAYEITSYLVDCSDYGIPQRRKRLVVFASKFDSIRLLDRTHSSVNYKTVYDAIGHLPPIEAGQVCETDPLHRAASLSELNMRRIKQSRPGGTWRDWVPDLVAECHKRNSGKTYASVYGRMTWDDPAPTITTQCYGYGSGRFGHPEQHRAISLREAAILQTFPDSYAFLAPDEQWSFKRIGRRIGNAVPVELGRVIAKSIAEHLEEQHDD